MSNKNKKRITITLNEEASVIVTKENGNKINLNKQKSFFVDLEEPFKIKNDSTKSIEIKLGNLQRKLEIQEEFGTTLNSLAIPGLVSVHVTLKGSGGGLCTADITHGTLNRTYRITHQGSKIDCFNGDNNLEIRKDFGSTCNSVHFNRGLPSSYNFNISGNPSNGFVLTI